LDLGQTKGAGAQSIQNATTYSCERRTTRESGNHFDITLLTILDESWARLRSYCMIRITAKPRQRATEDADWNH
jgi:hypothetical protein